MAYPLHRAARPTGTPSDDGPAAPQLPASPDLPALEREVLAYWERDRTFQASVDQRVAGEDASGEFVFYDGPPFANGLPHYGHLLTGYAKDVVGRYQTQRGRRVERRFGWDTHGLPAEMEAERQLGITDKAQIEQIGVAEFNRTCRESVLRYTGEWREYVTRQARWVDFDNDYKTLDLSYMESVMWAFKQLHDKGLVYEGHRVLPYSWNEQTPLSNQETRLDDSYKMRQDPALTVRLPLHAEGSAVPELDGAHALIWTTTPWTLPSNLAIAVHPDVEYLHVRSGAGEGEPERVVLAAERLPAYARELGEEPVVLGSYRGSQLVGLGYRPPFDFFTGREHAHRVLAADFVTTTDGTGLVHLAPAFGEDDKEVCDAAGIELVLPLTPGAVFTAEVPPYEGLQVFDANPVIIKDLKAAGRVLRHETIEHSYPHSWRSGQPLIYMAVPAWFVAVTAIRDRMVELNREITWVPDHIRDGQFGKWLEGARDWNVSRNRYWGSPIPVWVSDDPAYPRTDVYGSLDELERDFGVRPTDLHRPAIDELTRPNPDDPTGRSTMRRVPEVLDVWFDSGSMPFAQVHYPFENAEWFEHHYPGDFIVEYIGQTRGWFYTLHVLATALFDRPAFRTSVSHGIVLGSDGRKMSKSLRNYPDVNEVFDRDGSDAMRWFLMASPILRGGNLVVTEEGIRENVRQVLLPLWNAYSFFSLYANAAREGAGLQARAVDPADLPGLPAIDRYLLARTHDLVGTVTAQLDAYDVPGACETVREHIDVLTNWYVRTQRERFWAEDQAAFDTLWTALETLTRVMAPLAPLLSEEVWRGLTGGRSVHLTDWPVPGATAQPSDAALVADPDLVSAMDQVRAVVSAALGLRKANRLRVRQPLRSLTVVVDDPAAVGPYHGLIAGELNVRQVTVLAADSPEAAGHGVTRRLDVNARAAGPRLGRGVQAVIRAAKAGQWHETAEAVVVSTGDAALGDAGEVTLADGEYELSTVVESGEAGSTAAAVLPGRGFVVLDLALDDELRAEGYVRDLVREVQDARKAAGLHVSDRIDLTVRVPEAWAEAVQAHRALIGEETLAWTVAVESSADAEASVEVRRAAP